MERETEITRTGYNNREQQIAIYERKVITFLWEAAREGADKKVPQGMTEEQWQRIKDIGKAYYYLTLSQAEVGKIYGITRAGIGRICESFIVNTYYNSSLDLQSRYPLQEILIRKPVSLLKRAPVALRVKEQIDQGVANRSEIARNTGLTPRQIAGAVQTLKPHRIAVVTDSSLFLFRELEKQFEKEEDDRRLQGMLDGLPAINMRGFIARNTGKEIFLSSLTNILTDAGFHVRSKELRPVADAIRNAGIPIRLADAGYTTRHGNKEYSQVYIIVLTRHKDRILEVIRQDSNLFGRLSDNPVKLAYGPEPDHYPNTTQLTDRSKYGYVGTILRERLELKHGQIKHYDLFGDCPVPIFQTNGGRLYPKDQEDVLVGFVEEELKKRMETFKSKAAI